MDWVEGFYTKQDEWIGTYAEPVGPYHRKRAALVDSETETRPLRVLELGCGGGQVASAIADRGHSVTAIDSNLRAIECARRLASARLDGRMKILHGDFYTIELDDRFDCVCYFDGFGVGSDEDQRRLLSRIPGWLTPTGRALVEVYSPGYWSKVAGRTVEWGRVSRRYDFDSESSRMLDVWWTEDDPSAAVTQSLRCYTPDEFRDLLEPTGLELESVHPGGAYDHDAGVYYEIVPVADAMQYVAIVRPTSKPGRG